MIVLFVGLDPGVLNDLGPFDDVGLDDGGEFLGRTTNRIETELSELLADIGLCCDLRNLPMQLAHDRCGRVGRCEQSKPGRRLETRVTGFRYRRWLRYVRRSFE